MKQAVMAPSMPYLLYPLNGNVEGYPNDEFVKDLVNEVCLSEEHRILRNTLLRFV